jgi:hypothetical protein
MIRRLVQCRPAEQVRCLHIGAQIAEHVDDALPAARRRNVEGGLAVPPAGVDQDAADTLRN